MLYLYQVYFPLHCIAQVLDLHQTRSDRDSADLDGSDGIGRGEEKNLHRHQILAAQKSHGISH